jgi:hypothetical protein
MPLVCAWLALAGEGVTIEVTPTNKATASGLRLVAFVKTSQSDL